MGPFAPRTIEQAGPYEHCPILNMIEWHWGFAPMTLRDRYARNFAEALDFTSRRDPIALPRFAAPPPTGCAARWAVNHEAAVSRKGRVRRVVEPPPGSRIRRARIVKVDESGEQPGQPYSQHTTKRVDRQGKVVLRMKLTEEARRAVAASDTGKVFAQLETTVVEGDGPGASRPSGSSWSRARRPPAASRMAHHRPGPGARRRSRTREVAGGDTSRRPDAVHYGTSRTRLVTENRRAGRRDRRMAGRGEGQIPALSRLSADLARVAVGPLVHPPGSGASYTSPVREGGRMSGLPRCGWRCTGSGNAPLAHAVAQIICVREREKLEEPRTAPRSG
jgi:hypothetical protein